MTTDQFNLMRPTINSLITKKKGVFWFINNPKAVSKMKRQVVLYSNEHPKIQDKDQDFYIFVETGNLVKYYHINTNDIVWKKEEHHRNSYFIIDFSNLQGTDGILVDSPSTLKRKPAVKYVTKEVQVEQKKAEKISNFGEILQAVTTMLEEKNKRYGDTSKKRLSIFENKCQNGQRIDEKIARVMNSEILRVNDVIDIIGYLTLTCEEKGWNKNDILNLID